MMNTLTADQHELLQTIGQGVTDLIYDEMGKHNDNDVQHALNIIVAVAAHFIAGIPDPELRQKVYLQFGTHLADHLNHLDGMADDRKAMVAMTLPKERLS